MEVYFNHKKYDSMRKLQEDYKKWLSNSDAEFFNLVVKDGQDILLDYDFIKNKDENNIFEYIHKVLTKKLIELDDNMYFMMNDIEFELDLIEELYVFYFNEMNIKETLIYYEDVNYYLDYLTDDDIFTMCQQCTLYDLENYDEGLSYDDLMEDYMNLSTEQLCYEFEQKYDYDYLVNKMEKQAEKYCSPIIQRKVSKDKEIYQNLKTYHFNNDISMEMKRKK